MEQLKRLWSRRQAAIILALLVLAGALIRLVKLSHESLNFDELASVWTSRLALGHIVTEAIAQGHPPAYNLAQHFLPMPAGDETMARLLPAFLGILTLPLVYLAGKELRSRSAGLWAAAFAAVCPLMIWYSRDATSYSWLTLFTLLSFYFLIRASRRGGWSNWAMYVIATLLVIFTYFLAFIVVIAGLTVFWIVRGPGKERVREWAISHAFLGFTLAIFFLLTASATSGRSGLAIPPKKLFLEDLVNWPLVFVRGYATQSIGGGVMAIGVPTAAVIAACAVVAALISLMAFRPVRERFLKLDVVAAGVYTLFLVAVPVVVQLASPQAQFASRYYAWAAPLSALFIALLLTSLPARLAWLAGVPLLLVMSYYAQIEVRVRRNENWRDIAAIIAARGQPDDEIMCFPEAHCVVAFAFYSSRTLPTTGGNIAGGKVSMIPGTWNGYKDAKQNLVAGSNELTDAIMNDVDGARRIWLVMGDGAVGNYPAAPQVNAVVQSHLRQSGNWDLPPLDLRLFDSVSHT
ncbi:MAG: glycosyltransferase family 39 protein [Thermoleophilia bacterium]